MIFNMNTNSFTTFFFIYVSFFSTFFFSSSSLVSALPLQKKDVISPPITSPDASTVWTVGSTQTVTWNVSEFTSEQLNGKMGMLVLGFDTFTSENLMLDNPLAQNFLLTDQKVQITVPDVPTRTNYIVVLFGDSGNTSPNFTITGSPSASSSTPLTSSSEVSSTPSPASSAASTTEAITSSAVVTPTTAVTSSPSESTPAPASSSVSAAADSNSSSSVTSPSSSARVTPSPTPTPSGTSAAFAMQIPRAWSMLLGTVLAGAILL